MNPTNQHFLSPSPGALITNKIASATGSATVQPLPPPRFPEPFLRAYVANGAPGADVSSGAVCAFDEVTRDIPASNLRYLLGGIEDGSFRFSYPGVYMLQYSAAIEVNLGGASTHETESNTAKTLIRAGGTEIETSAGYFGAEQKMNLSGFLKKDNEEPWAPTVDLKDLVTYTQPITAIPVVDGETLPSVTSDPSDAISAVSVAYGGVLDETFGVGGTYIVDGGAIDVGFASGLDPTGTPSATTTPSNAVTNVTLSDVVAVDVLPETCLEDDNRLKATADFDTSRDFAVNPDGVAVVTTGGGGITGSVKGTASGMALVFVEYDSSNVLKINLSGTMVDPTVDVFGSRDGTGGRPITCVNVSLSILRISGPRPTSAWESP